MRPFLYESWCDVPTGRVEFFDEEKGLGSVADDDGTEVSLSGSTLPIGSRVKAGTRVKFSVADAWRGPQALTVAPKVRVGSLACKNRRKPEEVAVIIEDLIRTLDKASNQLRHGRHLDGGRRIASALRRLVSDLGT